MVRRLARLPVFLLALLLLSTSVRAGGGPAVLTLSHASSRDSMVHVVAERLRAHLFRNHRNMLSLKVQPEGIAASADTELSAVLHGDVDMILAPVSRLEALSGELKIFQMPMLLESDKALQCFVASPAWQDTAGEIQESGVKVLGVWGFGGRQISASRPILAPYDLRNLKIWTEKSSVNEGMYRALGASPVSVSAHLLSSAIERQLVTATDAEWETLVFGHVDKVQRYITEINFAPVVYMVIVNLKKWNGLTDQGRKAILSSVERSGADSVQIIKAINARYISEIRQSGYSTIISMNDQDKRFWKAAANKFYESFEGEVRESSLNQAKTCN